MTTAISNGNKEYLAEARELKKNLETGFLILAEHLYKIRESEMWRGEYDSYEEFISDLDISRFTDCKLRAVYRRFVVEYKLPLEQIQTIAWTSLYTLSTKVQDKKVALSLLEKAETLRGREWLDEVRIASVGEHICVESREIKLAVCDICGKMTRKS